MLFFIKTISIDIPTRSVLSLPPHPTNTLKYYSSFDSSHSNKHEDISLCFVTCIY